jgi:hypothetical protein
MSVQGRLADFEALLLSNISEDSGVRDRAFEQLSHLLRTDFNNVIHALALVLRQSRNRTARHLAANRLTSYLTRGEPTGIESLPPELADLVKQEVLKGILEEPDAHIRTQICDTATQIAIVVMLKEQRWDSLLPFVKSCASSPNPGHRVAGFMLLRGIGGFGPDSLVPVLRDVHQIYLNGLKDADMIVRREAAMALLTHIPDSEYEPKQCAPFQELLPGVRQALTDLIRGNLHDEARKVIRAMVDAAHVNPRFFRPHLESMAQVMEQVVRSKDLELSLRRSGMEWFVSVCQFAPKMAKAKERFMRMAISSAMELMLMVEDDPDWPNETDENNEGKLHDDTLFDAGETALSRICTAVRLEGVQSILFPIIQQFMSTPDWRYRHAGVYAITYFGELLPLAKLPMNQIVSLFSDKNPRLAYAAIHCVGLLQLTHTDLSPSLHALVIPPLIRIMDARQMPRLQYVADASMINLLEDLADDSAQYMEQILAVCSRQITGGRPDVQHVVLTVLAQLASAVKERILPHYPMLMGNLRRLLTSSMERKMLWIKALEAATSLCTTVTRAHCRGDALEICGLIMRALETPHANDDLSLQYILQSLKGLASLLEEDFVPFLPNSVRFALSKARTEVKNEVRRIEQYDDEEREREQQRAYSENLDDKAQGVSCLAQLVADMYKHMGPYLQQSFNCLLELTGFVLHEDIRETAIASMPHCVKSAVYCVQQGQLSLDHLGAMINAIVRQFLTNFKSEHDVLLIRTLLSVLKDCLSELGSELAVRFLGPAQLEAIFATLVIVLRHSLNRIEETQEQLEIDKEGTPADDEDEDQMDAVLSMEEQVMVALATLMAAIMEAHKGRMMPAFVKEFLPSFAQHFDPEVDSYSQRFALNVLDDLVIHVGEDAQHIAANALPHVLLTMSSDDTDLLRAAALVLGSIAEYMPELFKRERDRILSALVGYLQSPKARSDPHYSLAADCALWALSRVIEFHVQQMPNHEQLVLTFFRYLPLQSPEASQEGPDVYGTVCWLLEKNYPLVVRELKRTLALLFIHALGSEFTDSELTMRVSRIAARVRAQSPDLLAQLRGEVPHLDDKLRDAAEAAALFESQGGGVG